MNISKYFYIGKINFKQHFTYLLDIIFSSLFIGIIVFVLFSLYSTVYGSNTDFGGFTIPMIGWYLVLAESFSMGLGRVVTQIGDDVKSGLVANYLNKPFHYLFYKYSSSIGLGLIRFVISFIISSIIVFSMVRVIPFSFLTLILVLVCVFLGMTLSFFMMALLGVFSFWFEDSRSLYLAYQKFVFILGGVIIPIDFLPGLVNQISSFLPFAYAVYYPSKLLVDFSFLSYFKIIIFQLCWILFFIIITVLLYNKFLKKVSINGG